MQKSRTESTTREKILNKHTLIPIILLIVIFTSTTSIAQDPPIQLGKGGITDIAYVADGTKIVVATTMGVKIYDAVTYQNIPILTDKNRYITCIDVSTDGNTFVEGDMKGGIYVWDAKTLKYKKQLDNRIQCLSIAINAKMDTIAVASQDGQIRTWDVRTGKQIKKISPNFRDSFYTVFNRDGTKLITGDMHGVLRMIDIETGSTGSAFGALNWCITGLTLTNDGNTLISSSVNGAISLWDISKL